MRVTPMKLSMSNSDTDKRSGSSVIEEIKNDLREPDMFRVLLHNDHYTTMDFVIEVLRVVFHKSIIEATKIMLDVHRKGIGVVGTFTLDIAKTKAARANVMARKREFPLKCTFEKA